MATEKFANNATTTLNGTITNVATTLVVTSAASFPSSPQFRIIVDSELMLVTGVSGTTFTVTRGIENTTATTHSSGTNVSQIVTNASLSQIITDNTLAAITVTSSGSGQTGVALQSAAITVGTNILTVTGVDGTSTFSVGDVGKAIQVVEAGPNGDLYTTISGFTNSTTVTLTANASGTVSHRTAIWYPVGQDDTTAIQNAINSCTADRGTVHLPDNIYVISSGLTDSQHFMSLIGGGMNNTYVIVSSENFAADMLSLSSARGYRIEDIAFKHGGFGASLSTSYVTAWSITSNVATITATNNFSSGQKIALTGFLNTGAIFNDQFVTLTAATGSTFTFAFTHANGSGTDSGAAHLDYNCISFPLSSSTLLYAHLERVQAMNAPGDGVKFALSVVCSFKGCVFLNNKGNGLSLYNSQNIGSTSTIIDGCYANGNELAGYYLHIVNYSVIRTCAADSNGVSYYLFSCKSVTLESCGSEATEFKSSVFPGIDFFLHGGQGNLLDGCYASKNSGIANASGTYIVLDNTSSYNTIHNPVFAGQLAQLPTNTFTIASGCVSNTIWEPYFNNNSSSAWTDSGTTNTIYTGGSHQKIVNFASNLSIGSGTVSTSGAVRNANATTIVTARNAANSANIGALSTDASDNVSVGDGTNSANVILNAKSGSTAQLQVASTAVLTASSSLITAAQGISLGTGTVSTTGSLRAANNTTIIAARNSGNTADIGVLGTTSTGSVTLGDGVNVNNVNLNVPSASLVQFQTAGSNAIAYTLRAAGATVQQFGSTVTSVAINQANLATNSGTGATLTIQAQNETGTTSTGGSLVLTSGTGTTVAGNVTVQTGGSTQLTVSPTLITHALPIALAGTVATSGSIREASATTIIATRNAANSANLGVLSTDASDNISVGDGVNNALVTLNAKSGSSFQLQVGSTNVLSGTSSLITAAQAIALGTGTVATAGSLRAANNTTVISARDSGNTKNISLLSTTSGGSVVVGDGSNATNINLNIPSANLIQFQSAGNNAIVYTLRDSGSTVQQFAATVTSASINQANTATNSATGATLTLQAQNATGTTSIGGALALTSGTGTTRYGDVSVVGPLAVGRFSQAMADAPQTISPANSINNVIVVTGTNTAVRALTISCAPSAGTIKIIDNQTINFGITAQFLTGTATGTIPPGTSAIVYGDGTNAQLLGLGASSSSSASGYGTYASRPSSAATGGVYYTTDGHTPFVYTGSVWAPLVNGVPGTQPQAASNFTGTTVNIGSATIADHSGTLEITGVNDSGTTTFRGWVVSSTINSVAMGVQTQVISPATANAFSVLGVFMRESSSSKAVVVAISVDHANNKVGVEFSTWTSNTARSVAGQDYTAIDPNGPVFIRLRKSGSNIITEWTRWNPNDTSATGWSQIRSDAITSIFTTTPDQEGIMTMGFNSQPHGYVLHFVNT